VSRSSSSEQGSDRLFPGDSELARLMRDLDWSTTDLGLPDTWPEHWRTAIRLCLTSRIPVVMYWGPNFTVLYNDPYISFLGEAKHPYMLGRPGKECWAEIWDTICPMLESVVATGEATWSEDVLMFFARRLPLEEVYVRFTFGPLLAADGRTVDGIFCPCTETTEQVVGARRLETLRKLGMRPAEARSVIAACREAAGALAENPYDISLAAVYLVDDSAARLNLIASAGLGDGHPFPRSVSLDSDDSPWSFASVFATRQPKEIADLGAFANRLRGGPRNEPTRKALVLPIPAATAGVNVGILVAGVSARRILDGPYRTFFDLVAGHLGTAIADAKAYEEERKRAEALAQLDRAKTKFFSNVSHEFRTPLTLMLSPLEDALDAPSRTLAGAPLEMTYRNALRLLKLVNTLLDFSRIEAGRVQASFEPVDLARLTSDLASVFRSAIERAGLTLTVACEPVAEPVYVDRELWEKIVMNLLSNAFKFTFQGGIGVRLRSMADRVVLEVSDTGTGISQEELPRVFERFHRIEGARARTHEGSGIGLALVQELVRLHGGEIHVESALGKGTTFTIALRFGADHLPADRLGAPRSGTSTSIRSAAFVDEAMQWLSADEVWSQPTTQKEMDRDVRILLADDNADMREYVASLLRERWTVEAVGDGMAALAAARERRPALVLTDVMMPGLDGFELLRELRNDPATRAIPVIMLSARAGEESRIQGLEAGADDYLVKPFSRRELLARVAARLDLQRLRSTLDAERAAITDLFRHTPVPVAILRGEDLVFEFANPAYLEVVKGREIVGKPLLEALPEFREQGFDDRLRHVMHTGIPDIGREAVLRLVRDGKLEDTYWTFIYAPMAGPHGDNDGVIAICNEVTEQVRARHTLESLAAEAGAANRAKDEFLAMLGHELRNPLAPILTALQLMRLRDIGGERERAVIERQVQHLVGLVEDLLDVSRITRGKIQLQKSRVALADVVARAVELASPLLEQKRHMLSVNVPRLDYDVEGDPQRLAQVVANLLTNAAKYTEPEGRISVDVAAEGELAVLTVRDTGMGIRSDMLPQIFDLFAQERQALDRSQGGLGLGLAIVRSLVALHGGTVTAHSAGPGCGSEFTIRLPRLLSAVPSTTPALPGEVVKQVSGKRVLIVDDNEDAAAMLVDALSTIGYETKSVLDAPTALRVAEEFQPEIALLDIGLPVVDGYQLARRFREDATLRRVRLVAVTGYGQPADRVRSKDAGFDEHLVKPVDLGELRRVLESFAFADSARQ